MEPVTMASSFTDLAGDLVTSLGTVAVAAVSILVIFLGWKYGKKLFNRVA